MCKGCTICVTGCPVEAIRVRNGKAYILEKKCIDCGECIRHCPNHAKYAYTTNIDELDAYQKKAALLAPSIYSQFNIHYSKNQIHNAFRELGFTHVFDVSEDALRVSRATARFILRHKTITEPFISSSCPTIIKLIQVRFPSLIENILPILPPVEVCARRARRELEAETKAGERIGIFLISPCSAKITVARKPVGYTQTAMNGAFAFEKLYLPLITALRKMRIEEKNEGTASPFYNDAPCGLAWGRQFGEAEYAEAAIERDENEDVAQTEKNSAYRFNWIASSGIRQVTETLEAIEDGQMSRYAFAELDACSGGCINGPLTVRPVSEGQAVLRNRLNTMKKNDRCSLHEKDESMHDDDLFFDDEIIGRQTQKLSDDFATAKKMMQTIDDIASGLPSLDCGSCGSPNCRALAEDIVRGKAKKEDCIFILKMKYEELLFGKHKNT